MASTVVGAVGTFVLSLILAYGCLRLRCRKIGPPFGPRARYWASFIVVATAIVSTGAGLVIVAASHHDLRPSAQRSRVQRAEPTSPEL